MLEIRETLKDFDHFRFIVDRLPLSSAAGKRVLLSTPWSKDPHIISRRLEDVASMFVYLKQPKEKLTIDLIASVLCSLHIIEGSIETLSGGGICSDIDFFEFKNLAFIERRIRTISLEKGIELQPMPSLENVIKLLDPDQRGCEVFYLSDSYSKELSKLRKMQSQAESDDEQAQIAELVAIEEEKIRKKLSTTLRSELDNLKQAYEALATDDILIAKAKWALENGAIKPEILTEGVTELTDLINPAVAFGLAQNKNVFQPVSIYFSNSTTLITGANMAGKSVLLSTIALAQILVQYGFFVPAGSAKIVLVDDVLVSFGDGQDLIRGLSSYAAEVLTLNKMIKASKQGKSVLILIDEAARTTNPEEGCAIVEALVRIFNKYHTRAIITTHYSGIEAQALRFRVKGFIEERIKKPLRINDLNQCMDYQLLPNPIDDTPKEALRIAEILGVDEEFLDCSRECLEKTFKDK